MKISDINLLDLFTALKTFSFKHVVNGEETTVDVNLWPDTQNAAMYKIFNLYYGSLKADELAEDIKNGDLTIATAAAVLKNILTPQWKQLFLAWIADYNPLWNVDGVETRVIETEHGLVVEHEKDSAVTNEQLTDAESTTEQLTDAESTTEQLTDGTATDYVSPESSNTFNPSAKTETNAGKVKATSNSGKIKTTSDSGKVKTTSNSGKTQSSTSGTDTDTQSGTTKVTDTFTRGGNIGITMTTQLLSEQIRLWSEFNFFPVYFKTLAKQLTIPIWED